MQCKLLNSVNVNSVTLYKLWDLGTSKTGRYANVGTTRGPEMWNFHWIGAGAMCQVGQCTQEGTPGHCALPN